jgi:hypothetical protein
LKKIARVILKDTRVGIALVEVGTAIGPGMLLLLLLYYAMSIFDDDDQNVSLVPMVVVS